MILKLADLEGEFRRLADDEKTGGKPRWSSLEIAGYATDAQIDACERGLLIEDDATPEICRIAVKAGKPTYELSPTILRVKRAKLDSQTTPLYPATPYELDRRGLAWDRASGPPWAFIDKGTKVQLVWIPNADDVLRIMVKRLPKCALKEAEDAPEINYRYHYKLLDGMLARGYRKKDTETYDPGKADYHEAAFTRSFGPKPNADAERKKREGPTIVRPSPYA